MAANVRFWTKADIGGILSRDRLSPDTYRRVKGGVDHPPCGIPRCRELIAVAVSKIDRDPVVRDSLVDPALEVTVAHIEKIIALKRSARRYPIAHKNAEDLAADFIIGGSVKHRVQASQRRLILASRDAP